MSRIEWGQVLNAAHRIVSSYDTSVTLRQLYYRLVAAQLIPNHQSAYKRLSTLTAEARRAGAFPALIDPGRRIHAPITFDSPAEAAAWVARIYQRDRTEGQDVSVYLAVEKSGIVEQLRSWFGGLGVPILALGGYSSESYESDIVAHVAAQGRPAVLLYGGDHDPSGWDIPRNFLARTDCWEAVHRVALTPEQVAEHDLPESIGKETDSRAAGFVERFGKLVQVELDALPPNVLRQCYADAINPYWDTSTYDAVMSAEADDIAALEELQP